MVLKFININPCLLLDKIIEAGISEDSVIVRNDCKEGKNIAENVIVSCLDIDAETIKEIAKNLDNVEEKAQLSEEERIKNLECAIEDLANMISELAEGGI